MGSVEDLINSIPKAELHLHVEGTLEPELKASWLDDEGRAEYLRRVDACAEGF